MSLAQTNSRRAATGVEKAMNDMAMATDGVGDEKRGSKPGNDRVQCVVVTPEKTLFDEAVNFVALPLYDGELGVLPGRSPLIGRLGFGELRTRTGDVVRRYFIDGGFAQVRDDVVTVLTNQAIPVDKLDATAAARELEILDAKRVVTDLEYAAHQKAVSRARGIIRVAGHKG
jgi:F-type H+-transporting ATPase subunit epsilon